MNNFNKFQELFVEESLNHLEEMKELLSNEKDIVFLKEELFRHAHSLKGMSATMGLKDITEIVHALETFFKDKFDGSSENRDFVFLVCSYLKKEIFGKEDKVEREIIEKKLDIFKENVINDEIEYKSEIFLSSDTENIANEEKIKIIIELNQDYPMLSVEVFKVIQTVEQITELIYVNQEENNLKLGDVNVPLVIELKMFDGFENFVNEILTYDGVKSVNFDKSEDDLKVKQVNSQFAEEEYLKVNVKLLDKMLSLLNNIFMINEKFKYDNLSEEVKKELFFAMDKEIEKSYDTLLDARLVSFETLRDGLNQLVQEYAKKSEKKINLVFETGNFEIDKRILEKLLSILVHIIKNSIDHGLENIDERSKNGKEIVGQITVKTTKIENGIEINIIDDGRGLELDKIKRKIIQMGIMDEKILSDYPEELLYNFIFYPSFSTSRQVSETSGRGVGLDAVKKMVENLQGEISVSSKKNIGTNVLIKLPSHLELLSVFIFKINNILYSVPVTRINKIVEDKLINDRKSVNIKNIKKKIFFTFSKNNFTGGVGIDEIIEVKESLIFKLPNILQMINGFLGWHFYKNNPVILMDPLRIWEKI